MGGPEPAPVLLRSPRLEATLLPGVGGKIAQIRDLSTDRPFLIPPQKPYCTLAGDRKWVEYDTSGMDDCFPNIDECAYPREPWRGVALPQMGEWVYGAWRVTNTSDDSVTMERAGGLLPYRARKTVRLGAAATIELEYSVENCGGAPLQYMWSAHPLIAAEEEFELNFPGGELSFVTFPPDKCVHRWPRFEALDLSCQWVPPGRDLKIFISGLERGDCELRFPDRALRFQFDVALTPRLGIWFNNLGFPSEGGRQFRCIAVEPCTSPSDVLDASDVPADPVLAPGASANWWLRIAFES